MDAVRENGIYLPISDKNIDSKLRLCYTFLQ